MFPQQPRRRQQNPYMLPTQNMGLPPMPQMGGMPQVGAVGPLPPLAPIQPPPPPTPFQAPQPPPMPNVGGINLGQIISQQMSQGQAGARALLPYLAQNAAEKMGLTPTYQQQLQMQTDAMINRDVAVRQAEIAAGVMKDPTQTAAKTTPEQAAQNTMQRQIATIMAAHQGMKYSDAYDIWAAEQNRKNLDPISREAQKLVDLGIAPDLNGARDAIAARTSKQYETIDEQTKQALQKQALQLVDLGLAPDIETATKMIAGLVLKHYAPPPTSQQIGEKSAQTEQEKRIANYKFDHPGSTREQAIAALIAEDKAAATSKETSAEKKAKDLEARLKAPFEYYNTDPSADNWAGPRSLMALANLPQAQQDAIIGAATNEKPGRQWSFITQRVADEYKAGADEAQANAGSATDGVPATASVTNATSESPIADLQRFLKDTGASDSQNAPNIFAATVPEPGTFPVSSTDAAQMSGVGAVGAAGSTDTTEEPSYGLMERVQAPADTAEQPAGDPMLEGPGGIGTGVPEAPIGKPTGQEPSGILGGIDKTLGALNPLPQTAEAAGQASQTPTQQQGFSMTQAIGNILNTAQEDVKAAAQGASSAVGAAAQAVPGVLSAAGSGQVAGTGIAALAGAGRGAGLVGLGGAALGVGADIYSQTGLPGADIAKGVVQSGPIGWMADIFDMVNNVVEPPWAAALTRTSVPPETIALAQDPAAWKQQAQNWTPKPQDDAEIERARQRVLRFADLRQPQIGTDPIKDVSEIYRYGREAEQRMSPTEQMATSLSNPAWYAGPVPAAFDLGTEALGFAGRLPRSAAARQELIAAVKEPGKIIEAAGDILRGGREALSVKREVAQAGAEMATQGAGNVLPQSETAQTLSKLPIIGESAFGRDDRATRIQKKLYEDTAQAKHKAIVDNSEYDTDLYGPSADPTYTRENLLKEMQDFEASRGLAISDINVTPKDIAERRAEMEQNGDVPQANDHRGVEANIEQLKNSTVRANDIDRKAMAKAAEDAQAAGWGNHGQIWAAARAQAQLNAIELAKSVQAAIGIIQDRAQEIGVWHGEDVTKVQVLRDILSDRAKTWERDRDLFNRLRQQSNIEQWSPVEFLQEYSNQRKPFWDKHDVTQTAYEKEYEKAVTEIQPVDRTAPPEETVNLLKEKGYGDDAIKAMTPQERVQAIKSEEPPQATSATPSEPENVTLAKAQEIADYQHAENVMNAAAGAEDRYVVVENQRGKIRSRLFDGSAPEREYGSIGTDNFTTTFGKVDRVEDAQGNVLYQRPTSTVQTAPTEIKPPQPAQAAPGTRGGAASADPAELQVAPTEVTTPQKTIPIDPSSNRYKSAVRLGLLQAGFDPAWVITKNGTRLQTPAGVGGFFKYEPFVNEIKLADGSTIDPSLIVRVEDAKGNVVFDQGSLVAKPGVQVATGRVAVDQAKYEAAKARGLSDADAIAESQVAPTEVTTPPKPQDVPQATAPPLDSNAPISDVRTKQFLDTRRLVQSARSVGVDPTEESLVQDMQKTIAGIDKSLPADQQEAARASAMEHYSTQLRQELSAEFDKQITAEQAKPKPDAQRIAKMQGLKTIADFQGAQDFLGYLKQHWAPKAIPKEQRVAALKDLEQGVGDVLAGKEPTITGNIDAVLTNPLNQGGAGIPSTKRGGASISPYEDWKQKHTPTEILNHALVTLTAHADNGMKAVLGVKPLAKAVEARIGGQIEKRLNEIKTETDDLSKKAGTAEKISALKDERAALIYQKGVLIQRAGVSDLSQWRDVLAQLDVDLRPLLGKNGGSKLVDIAGEAMQQVATAAHSENGAQILGDIVGDPQEGQRIADAIKNAPGSAEAAKDPEAAKNLADRILSYIQRRQGQVGKVEATPTELGTSKTAKWSPGFKTGISIARGFNSFITGLIIRMPAMLVHVAEATAEGMVAHGVPLDIYKPVSGPRLSTEIRTLSKSVLPSSYIDQTGAARTFGYDVKKGRALTDGEIKQTTPQKILDLATLQVVPRKMHWVEYNGRLATWDHFYNGYLDEAINQFSPSARLPLDAMLATEKGVGAEATQVIQKYLPRIVGPKDIESVFNEAQRHITSNEELTALERWRKDAVQKFLSMDTNQRRGFMAAQDIANRATINKLDTLFINRSDYTRIEGALRQIFPFLNYDTQMPAIMARAFFEKPALGNAFFEYYRQANQEAQQPGFPQRARGELLANVGLPLTGGAETGLNLLSGTLGAKYGRSLTRGLTPEGQGQSITDVTQNYFTPGFLGEAGAAAVGAITGSPQMGQTLTPESQALTALSLATNTKVAGNYVDLEARLRQLMTGEILDPYVTGEEARQLADIMTQKGKSVDDATAEDRDRARQQAGVALLWNELSGYRVKSITGGEQTRMQVLADGIKKANPKLALPENATPEQVWQSYSQLDALDKARINKENPWLPSWFQVSEQYLPRAERLQREGLRNFSTRYAATYETQRMQQSGRTDLPPNDPHYGYYQDASGAWLPSADQTFAQEWQQSPVQAVTDWKKAHHDLLLREQGARQEVAGEYKDVLDKQAQQTGQKQLDPRDAAWKEYLAISPDKYIASDEEAQADPEASSLASPKGVRGAIDWQAYYSARAQWLAGQPPDVQNYIKQMQQKNVSSPVEASYYKALDELDQLSQIPEYLNRDLTPMTQDQAKKINEAKTLVARAQAMERAGQKPPVSSKALAAKYNISQIRSQPLNDAYVKFITDHPDLVTWGLARIPTQQKPTTKISGATGMSLSPNAAQPKPKVQPQPQDVGLGQNWQQTSQMPPMPTMGAQ